MSIHVSKLWLLWIIVVMATHLYKVMFFLFVLMSLHELCHIICAKCLGYKVSRVCVYPFGLSACIEHFEYQRSGAEIAITLSGLSVHLVAAALLPLLPEFSAVSQGFAAYLVRSNYALLLFNCMPIYPLDGGRLLRNILEFIWPFKVAKCISLISSVALLPCVFLWLPFTVVQALFFTSFFVVQIIMYIYKFSDDVKTFYLYRFLHPIKRRAKFHTKGDVYKNRENFFVRRGGVDNERRFLSEYIE